MSYENTYKDSERIVRQLIQNELDAHPALKKNINALYCRPEVFGIASARSTFLTKGTNWMTVLKDFIFKQILLQEYGASLFSPLNEFRELPGRGRLMQKNAGKYDTYCYRVMLLELFLIDYMRRIKKSKTVLVNRLPPALVRKLDLYLRTVIEI